MEEIDMRRADDRFCIKYRAWGISNQLTDYARNEIERDAIINNLMRRKGGGHYYDFKISDLGI